MKRKLNVLLLMDSPYFLPRGHSFENEFKELDWEAEADIYKSLLECGYNVRLLALYNDISILFEEIKENRPDVVFNMAEVFKQKPHFDKNVVWLLEMLDVPYTGASPESLLICNNKALTKEILSFHRIRVPRFYTFYRNHRVWRPRRINLPIVVKPLSEEASRGISLASVVDSDEALVERIKFIHEKMNADAIIEEYIEGREFYVSLIGNKKVKVLPLREMKFGSMCEDEPRIATYKAKWDYKYREKWGIKNVFAGRLAADMDDKVADICKRAYRVLNMQCYARFDIRITPNNMIYIIEANANPSLEKIDEVAQSAQKLGISYTALIKKIISLAFKRKA